LPVPRAVRRRRACVPRRSDRLAEKSSGRLSTRLRKYAAMPCLGPGPADTVRSSVSEAESLFGQEHVRRYRETNGAVGHIWKRGSKTLLLTTSGRRTGKPTTTPLIYEQTGDNYVVVASQGGAPKHPGWYRNLTKTPEVDVQVKGDVFKAVARTV